MGSSMATSLALRGFCVARGEDGMRAPAVTAAVCACRVCTGVLCARATLRRSCYAETDLSVSAPVSGELEPFCGDHVSPRFSHSYVPTHTGSALAVGSGGRGAARVVCVLVGLYLSNLPGWRAIAFFKAFLSL